MHISFKTIISIAVSVASLGQLCSAGSTIPIESLTYSRDLWMSQPSKITSRASYINWNDLQSANKNLTLWGQPVKSVKLSGDLKIEGKKGK